MTDVDQVLARFRELADKADRTGYYYRGEVRAADVRNLCDTIERERREAEAVNHQQDGAQHAAVVQHWLERVEPAAARNRQTLSARSYARARRLLGIESEGE